MNVLIAGDSFGAEWPTTGNNQGWPNLLISDFKITNISRAGVSEYKILKQIQSIDQRDFDIVVVNHTSPGRVHTRKHPIHSTGLHENCDLLYNDIDGRFSMFNRALQSAKDWFLYHYDDNYQKDIYQLIRKQIDSIITIPYLAVSHMPISAEFCIEKNHLDLSNIWARHRGDVNHYSKEGNQLVALTIENNICEMMKY
jgi:hypothetical protein